MENLIEQSLVSQRKAVKESWSRFEHNRNSEWGLAGHDSGIHPLNMLIGGLVPSKLTTIAARSGMGKTASTVQMFDAGRRILRNRRAEFLFATWEMSPSYLVDRHISYKMGITNKILTQGAKLIGSKNLSRIQDAYRDATQLPVTYIPMITNISQFAEVYLKFCKRVHEKSEREGVRIIPAFLVDYIGLANGEGKHAIRSYDIADFMNGSKALVNETGGNGIIFAQMKRSSDEKDYPTRSDLADSSFIENASDNLILLHRPEYLGVLDIVDPETNDRISSKNKMLMRVLKSRDYGIGDKVINCDVKYNRFYDMHHLWDTEYWKLYDKEDFWKYELGFTQEQYNINSI